MYPVQKFRLDFVMFGIVVLFAQQNEAPLRKVFRKVLNGNRLARLRDKQGRWRRGKGRNG